MLYVSGRDSCDERGSRVVDGDGERGRHVDGAGAGANERLDRGRVRIGLDGHGLGELRDALSHRVVREPHATRGNHLPHRETAAWVGAAGPQEHDGARLHLGELHGRSRRRHWKAYPDDPGRHVSPPEPRAHPVPEHRLQRGELGVKRREEEEVAAHVRGTLYLSPRAGWRLATSGRAD